MTICTLLLRGFLRRAHREERGQVLIFFAMFIVSVGLAMGVVAVDASFWHSERRVVQSAADAAALAAAQDIPSGDASKIAATARYYAALDGYDHNTDPNVAVNVSWPPSTPPHAGDRQYVEVTIDSPSAGFFVGAFAGVLAPHHGARAVAKLAGGTLSCGIYALKISGADVLSVKGNGALTVNGGCVQVNSSDKKAAEITGNGSVTSGGTMVNGKCSATGHGQFTPPCTSGAPAVADPLASVPIPSVAGPNQGDQSGGGTIRPGLYRNLTVSSHDTLTLTAGVYVVTGGMSVSAQGTITGTGVMVYFACSSYPTPCNSGQSGAGVSMSGQGTLNLSPASSGPYKGLTIFYDRNNTKMLQISGNGATFSGTIYAKSAEMEVTGNGGIQNSNSAIVVDHLEIDGNGGVTIGFTPGANYPPSPGASLIE